MIAAIQAFILALSLTAIAGWITNVIWTFHQSDTLSLILGIVGIFVAPVGAVHGIVTWF